MKLSEFIEDLQQQYKILGDVEVVIEDDLMGEPCNYPLQNTVVSTKNHSRLIVSYNIEGKEWKSNEKVLELSGRRK
jgi:hypothetical protein